MKVCLIGNNITSLLLADILSKKNFKIEIHSKKVKKYKFETRTIGITDHNFTYLAKQFKNITKISNSINEIKILIKNKNTDDKILFNKNSAPLFHMVKYDKFFTYIKSKVASNKKIVFRNFNKNSKLNNLINDKKFKLIINCENSNALTKKYLKKSIFKNYNNKAFTTIIKHSKIKNHSATQIFTRNGPIAFLPLSEALTSVVYSHEIIKNKSINDKDILEIIKNFNPLYKNILYKKIKIESFYLNLVLPKKYYNNKILFFGDSIHTIHPLAGQGLNMTIRDIINFEKIIEDKINLGLEIDKSIYKEFENKTKSFNVLFSTGVDLIYEFFRFNKNFVPEVVSKKIFSFINKNKGLKDLSTKLANSGPF